MFLIVGDTSLRTLLPLLKYIIMYVALKMVLYDSLVKVTFGLDIPQS